MKASVQTKRSLWTGVAPSSLLILALSAIVHGSSPEQNPLSSRLSGMECGIWNETGPSFGVLPHVKAEDELQALACMGYLHGRDRAWQMDYLKRIAQGRTAEIQGFGQIRQDFQMRLLGLKSRAQSIFEKMDLADQEKYWAYAYGANRGLKTPQARNAYEFRSMGYAAEEWQPSDSIAILLLESFQQTEQDFTRKVKEEAWLKEHGTAASRLFARSGLPWDMTILKKGEYPTRTLPGGPPIEPKELKKNDPLSDVATRQAQEFSSFFPAGAGTGSNSWVIGPSLSESGHAWLANDPHLNMTRPPFWYWVHISGGSYDAIGATLPGMPAITSGTNRSVSWGLTNSYFDVTSLDYVSMADLRESKTTRPWIWVKLGPFQIPYFFKTYRRTAQGWPILPLSDVPPGKALVLRWSGFDAGPSELRGLTDLLSAKSAEDADRILSTIGLPSWNFVFADTQGNIGYRVIGKLPKREKSPVFGIGERSLGELEPWTYLSSSEAPHLFKPARDYIVTANNQQWPEDAAFDSGRAHDDSFRAFRIDELLTNTPKHDIETIRRVQCDVQAIDARFLARPLMETLRRVAGASLSTPLTGRESAVLSQLEEWDYDASLSCRPCGVFSRWKDRLYREANLDPSSLYRELALQDPDPNASFNESVLKAFRESLSDLDVDPDGTLKPWGEQHRNFFTHFSGEEEFDVPSIATPGVTDSVDTGSGPFDPKLGVYRHDLGASQRLVVELADPPAVYSILPGINQDVIERPALGSPTGPWVKWVNCELEKRTFPVDWSSVTSLEHVRL